MLCSQKQTCVHPSLLKLIQSFLKTGKESKSCSLEGVWLQLLMLDYCPRADLGDSFMCLCCSGFRLFCKSHISVTETLCHGRFLPLFKSPLRNTCVPAQPSAPRPSTEQTRPPCQKSGLSCPVCFCAERSTSSEWPADLKLLPSMTCWCTRQGPTFLLKPWVWSISVCLAVSCSSVCFGSLVIAQLTDPSRSHGSTSSC